MTIIPDARDWTTVLETGCEECGSDAATFDLGTSGALLRDNAAAWHALLTKDRRGAARRSFANVWSAVEYACHVRDVCRVFDERLARLLAEDNPRFANWDQGATATDDGYAAQSAPGVAHELAVAAEVLAARLDTVAAADWSRSGKRSNGAVLSAEMVARLLRHEMVHHLQDAMAPRVNKTVDARSIVGA